MAPSLIKLLRSRPLPIRVFSADRRECQIGRREQATA